MFKRQLLIKNKINKDNINQIKIQIKKNNVFFLLINIVIKKIKIKSTQILFENLEAI